MGNSSTIYKPDQSSQELGYDLEGRYWGIGPGGETYTAFTPPEEMDTEMAEAFGLEITLQELAQVGFAFTTGESSFLQFLHLLPSPLQFFPLYYFVLSHRPSPSPHILLPYIDSGKGGESFLGCAAPDGNHIDEEGEGGRTGGKIRRRRKGRKSILKKQEEKENVQKEEKEDDTKYQDEADYDSENER
jgi:hypothetical protein